MMNWKKLSIGRILIGLQQIWIVLTCVGSGFSAFEPTFLDSPKNVTQVQGKDASFRCMVDSLGDKRIAWIKVDTKAILAIEDRVITSNSRLSVTMNDKVTWTFHIRHVQREDHGFYMCQINTEPMKMQQAYLEVVIPPDIISNETTGDLMVPEGGTAKLICRATGYPSPTITWQKEDGSNIIIKEGHTKRKVKKYQGEILTLYNIKRSEMGAYLCIASNGVQPTPSKRVMVLVHFLPSIEVPNQMVAAPRGFNVTIECFSEASPKAINYWMWETGGMIISKSSGKFQEEEQVISNYGVRMRLHIHNIASREFTGFICKSQNSIGSSEAVVHIHEIPSAPSDTNDFEDPHSRGRHEPLPAVSIHSEDRHVGGTADLHENGHPIETSILASNRGNKRVSSSTTSLSLLTFLAVAFGWCSSSNPVFQVVSIENIVKVMFTTISSHVKLPELSRSRKYGWLL